MSQVSWDSLAEKSIQRAEITQEEAESVLHCEDTSLLALLDAAYRVRSHYFANRVKLNFLLNAKSGLCPEDCFYCSQSKISNSQIDKYPFLSEREILSAAGRAVSVKAKRFCMVNSGRGPTDPEIAQISSAVKKVKGEFPNLEVCVCLGLLNSQQAETLKSSGVDAYNHNLNTSPSHYSEICSTHTYQDRRETVETAKSCGLSSCSGCLLGMGESEDDILEIAFTFRKMGVDSIPINFLIPIEGTPFAKHNELTPQKCLKILCLFRFLNPNSEIRIAGGREFHLRWLQPLGLFAANSIFIGDYLTTKGQNPQQDLDMIRDLGFVVEGDSCETSPIKEPPAPHFSFGPEDFSVRLKNSLS